MLVLSGRQGLKPAVSVQEKQNMKDIEGRNPTHSFSPHTPPPSSPVAFLSQGPEAESLLVLHLHRDLTCRLRFKAGIASED